MFKVKGMSLTQQEAVVFDYKEGKTLNSIAKELGCSIPTVAKLLEDKGVPRRHKGRTKNTVKETV